MSFDAIMLAFRMDMDSKLNQQIQAVPIPTCPSCGRVPFIGWGKATSQFLAVHRSGCKRETATGNTRAECLENWKAIVK